MIAILAVLIAVVIAQGGAVYYLVVVLPHRVAQLVAAERAASTTAAAEVARVARELHALAYWIARRAQGSSVDSSADVETPRKPDRAAAPRERSSHHGGPAVIAAGLGPRPGAQAARPDRDPPPPRSVTLPSMKVGEGGGL